MECYKCRVSEDRALLFDIILPENIEKICRKCSFTEDFPIIEKKEIPLEIPVQRTFPPKKEIPKRLPPRKISPLVSKEEELKKEEQKIKEVLNRNFRRTVGTTNLRDDLIDNFHWVVMRARRARHLSQKQVGESIRESEISIRMFERGIINNPKLVEKIEDFLSIRIRKDITKPFYDLDEYPEVDLSSEEEIDFGKIKSLKVRDLKELKDRKESLLIEDDSMERPFNEADDLSDEELDELLRD